MNRLTFRATDRSPQPCDPINCIDRYSLSAMNNVICRLAAYEDTGLTPEEVTRLQFEYDLNQCAHADIIKCLQGAEIMEGELNSKVDQLTAENAALKRCMRETHDGHVKRMNDLELINKKAKEIMEENAALRQQIDRVPQYEKDAGKEDGE